MDLTELQQALSRTPSILQNLIDPLPPEAMTYREAEGAWNPFEVVCHMADGEITDWMPRIRLILSDAADKRFVPFDREGGFRRYQGWTAAAVVDDFARLRQANLATLMELPIGPPDLERTGIHPELGRVTLQQLLATWVTHDFAHLSQMSRILVRYHGRDVGPWSKFFSLLAGPSSA